MKVTFAVFADYVNLSQEGKLNILGIFNIAFLRSLPGGLPNRRVVVRFRAEPEERGCRRSIRLRFIDPDGQVVLDETGAVDIPTVGPPGPVGIDLDTTIQVLPFKKYGPHRMEILVDGLSAGEIEVTALPPPASAG